PAVKGGQPEELERSRGHVRAAERLGSGPTPVQHQLPTGGGRRLEDVIGLDEFAYFGGRVASPTDGGPLFRVVDPRKDHAVRIAVGEGSQHDVVDDAVDRGRRPDAQYH